MHDATAALSRSLSGRYVVGRELGRGGMATVYSARDLKHDRDVAIKVMRSDLAESIGRSRFLREIQLAAKLTHPHILPLYDSGDADGALYYVMPIVEGNSLRERLRETPRLPIDEAVRFASEVARALDFAHRHDVVHRDIKPENIMIQDGHVLVADFGIGKAIGSLETDNLTQTGVIGTPAYMSPEQVSGQDVDGRSDIYSLGCVLYEMLVGEQPFTGPNLQAVITKRLAQDPADVTALREDVPRSVARALQRALSRAPADRYDSAAFLVKALDRGGVSERSAAPKLSLAVLPFVNRSADTDNQYFSDGLSEDLTNALSGSARLHVASRTSAFRFRGGDRDIRDIGAQLNVANVLEGSVRRSGAKLRITVQLVDVSTGYQLWTERYDREMTDVFEIQDEIVAAIVSALMPTLLGEKAPVVPRSTANLEAYELYLKGRHYWHQRSPATLRIAIQCFQQAIALDQRYALAYCGLADCYGILRVYGWTPASENRRLAEAAVTQAMALAPDLAEANFSKGFYTFYFERRWRDAGPHFKRATELNPRSPLIQMYTGLFHSIEGDVVEMRRRMEATTALDPLSPFSQALSSSGYYILGQFDEAERLSARALELQSDYLLAFWTHGLALVGQGRFAEGIADLERATTVSRAPIFICMLGFGLGRAGRYEEARRLIAELDDRAARGEYVPAFARLGIYVGLDDLDGVRRALTACVADVTPPFSFRVTTGVDLDRYRGDPDVARLLDAWFRGDDPTLR
ncbi:MAG: protein kinase [Vicinamibacterales bacterium]